MDIVEEAIKLVKQAHEADLEIRLMGGLAIMLHSPGQKEVYRKIKRPLTDIDLLALSKDRKPIREFLQSRKYSPRYDLTAWFGYGRSYYQGSESGIQVDVFFDKISMCHEIDLRNRLKLDFPTLSLADLFLCKMQIVKMAEKDLIDLYVLLNEHKFGDKEPEEIDSSYISQLLSKDWGFYYTISTNLEKLKNQVSNYLPESDAREVENRIDALFGRIEREPKSMGWKIRSKIGPRKQWYREVETKNLRAH